MSNKKVEKNSPFDEVIFFCGLATDYSRKTFILSVFVKGFLNKGNVLKEFIFLSKNPILSKSKNNLIHERKAKKVLATYVCGNTRMPVIPNRTRKNHLPNPS